MSQFDAAQPALIQQLRGVAADSAETRPTTGVVSAVGSATIDVQLGTSGTIMHGLSVSGGVSGVFEGDTVYLMWVGPQPLAISTRSAAAGTAGGVLPAHTHNDIYYLKSYVDSQVQSRAPVNHNHDPLRANAGYIGGWTVDSDGIYEIHTRLSSQGFLSLGPTPAVNWGYPSWGTGYGVWLGWDYGATDQAHAETSIYQNDPEGNVTAAGPKFALYQSATDYLVWTGTKLLVKAANFTLSGLGKITAASVDLTGKITATSGDIAGWHITGTAIVKDTGVAGTSAGLEPVDYPFYSGAVYTSRASAPFRVTSAGALYATGATISGAVTATSGDIAGWHISGTAIIKDTGAGATSAGLEPVDWPFYSGATYANRATAPFRVSNAGVLSATGATISGTLTATAGAIGGWTIAAGTLSSANIILSSTADRISVGTGLLLDGATQQIWVGSTGPRILIDGLAKNLRTDSYVGSAAGFKLDGITGSAEFNNLTARGEFHASVFVADEQHAIAGSQIALPSAALYAAVTTL